MPIFDSGPMIRAPCANNSGPSDRVWRGGVTIMMRAVLAAQSDATRTVWVADSFEGLPVPDAAIYPADAGLDWSHVDILKVDAATVQANFERYGLWDDQVRLLEGWFSDTLPIAPIDRLAVARSTATSTNQRWTRWCT